MASRTVAQEQPDDARLTRSGRVVAFAEPRDPTATTAVVDVRLTVAQAAAEAAVSEQTIRRAYVHGHLPVHRFGLGARSLRITRRELLAWLEAGGQTGTAE